MKFWKYFLILLVVPLLIIGIAYGIVKVFNAGATETPPIYVQLDRDILMPWQGNATASIQLDFSGYKKTNKKVGKANIILIIDSSGSMGAGRGSRFEIARSVIGNFIDNFSTGEDTKMGVMLFDSNVSQQVPLSTDHESVKKKLFEFSASGGGTDFLPPMKTAYQWLEPSITAKTLENNFVIFLTDGEADAGEPNRFYRENLLPHSVIVFCVGVGDGAMYENLANILRDEQGNVPPNRVLTCDDPVKLQLVYDQVGEEIGNVIGKQGQMAMPFAYRAFLWADPQDEPDDKKKSGISLRPPDEREKVSFFNWPILFARKYSYHLPLEARTFGIIKPFYDEIPFHFYDIDGNKVELESKRVPYLLKVTWLFLLLLYLPLLMFLMYWLLHRRNKSESMLQEKPLLVLGDREKRPGVLPRQYIPERSRMHWIPTLVIGLGRGGRHVLTHLKQNMDDLQADNEGMVRLLSIDTAAEEVFGSHPDIVPGTIVALDKETEIYVPGEHLRNVKEVVDLYKDNSKIDPGDPLTGLDLKAYAKLPDSVLGLSEGTHRHAALAMAYLVKELELDTESPLLQRLKDDVAKLGEQARESNFMQIIITGNSNGGTASGLMTAMDVLMRRLVEKTVDKSIAVEINLCPVDDRCGFEQPGMVPIVNRVLLDELDCISQAGRVYQPFHLVRETAQDTYGILRGLLTRKPHNNVYTFARRTDEPDFDLYPEAADNLIFFVERTARIETRQFIESIRSKEGEIRKNQKIESFFYMNGRSIVYPSRFIKEYLKILFINDVFSDNIALKGLNTDTLAIQPSGTIADLYDRPAVSRLFFQEVVGKKNNIWVPLLKGGDVAPFLADPGEDAEQFIYFLQKAFSSLLNDGTYSLTGLDRVIDDLGARCSGITESNTDKSLPGIIEIENVLKFLAELKEKLTWWLEQLLGTSEKEGLVQQLRKSRTRLEEIRKQLLKMNHCRVILGLDNQTPSRFCPDSLRQQWIAWWLNLENTSEIYDHLKQRCLWSIVPQDVNRPQLTFEFLGDHRHLFTPGPELTPRVITETELIADRFLEKLKDITILQLLAEYEKSSTGNYSLQHLAEQFHKNNRSPNLFYIHLLPHHARIRLNKQEENYINRLKKEMDDVKYAYEQFLYPPSSNQYRIVSIQVSYLLTGNYKHPHGNFAPVRHLELLKKENHLMINKLMNVDCPKEIPFYYAVFYYRTYFETFCTMWAAGKIFQDPHDRLWKLQTDSSKYKLTFLQSESLMDAALHFVLSDHLPFVTLNAAQLATDVASSPPKPDKKLLKILEQEVRDNNTFYCWMKLYLDGGKS